VKLVSKRTTFALIKTRNMQVITKLQQSDFGGSAKLQSFRISSFNSRNYKFRDELSSTTVENRS
jgi:hypothetical protein